MIFITLGSQKFQFNRVLEYLDELLSESEYQKFEVFAQIGFSTYKPKNFKYKDFLSREEFKLLIDKSDIVITHGGTGAIVTALKLNKIVFAIPRLREFGEHVDNHQIEIVDIFYTKRYIEKFNNKEELKRLLQNLPILTNKETFQSNTSKYLKFIKSYGLK